MIRLPWFLTCFAALAASCILEQNVRDGGVAPDPFLTQLTPLVRPGGVELWAPGVLGTFDPHLVEYSRLDAPRTVIDGYREIVSGVQNYLAETVANGDVTVTRLTGDGVGAMLGEELVVTADNGTTFFQLWCNPLAYFVTDTQIFLDDSQFCSRPTMIGFGPTSTRAVLAQLQEDGPIYDVDLAPDAVALLTPVPITLPSELDRTTVRFIERQSGDVLVWVTEASGVWTYNRSDASPLVAESSLTGGAAGSQPVRRDPDGSLRIVTLDGLYRWNVDDDGSVSVIALSPAPSINASWVSDTGYGVAIARENVPNSVDPTLEMPFALQARVVENDAFVVHDIPTTPCVDAEKCRALGESRVVGLAGGGGSWHIVYEVWSWYIDATGLDVKALYSVPL